MNIESNKPLNKKDFLVFNYVETLRVTVFVQPYIYFNKRTLSEDCP